jgi:hypothetical protein
MTEEELEQFDRLYKYVKYNILNYEDNMNVSTNIVLRLRGLSTGRYYDNKDTYSRYQYTFDEVLLAFRFCTMEINRALKKEFENDDQKMNYICTIVENNIAEVVMYKKQQENKEYIIEHMDFQHVESNKTEYKKKEKKSNNKLKDMW